MGAGASAPHPFPDKWIREDMKKEEQMCDECGTCMNLDCITKINPHNRQLVYLWCTFALDDKTFQTTVGCGVDKTLSASATETVKKGAAPVKFMHIPDHPENPEAPLGKKRKLCVSCCDEKGSEFERQVLRSVLIQCNGKCTVISNEYVLTKVECGK
jgi:hypothetical protein